MQKFNKKSYRKWLDNNSTYTSWRAAKERCSNPRHHSFKFYGGRGILFLIDSFHDIERVIGRRPNKAYTLDRINSLGHYTLDNIRWATRQEQAHNSRHTKLSWDAVCKIRKSRKATINALAKEFNAHRTTISNVLKYKTWRTLNVKEKHT